uniref:Uncharacterized protein n=1 Tax=Ascaris lumbricoides TaxID=6252 RepID=A0A0M3IQR0_ASCLU
MNLLTKKGVLRTYDQDKVRRKKKDVSGLIAKRANKLRSFSHSTVDEFSGDEETVVDGAHQILPENAVEATSCASSTASEAAEPLSDVETVFPIMRRLAMQSGGWFSGMLRSSIELVPTNESGDFDSSIRASICGTKNVTRRNVAVMDRKKPEQKNSIVFPRVLSGDVSEIAAGGDIQLVQTTKVIEGDTMVVQFRAHRKAHGTEESGSPRSRKIAFGRERLGRPLDSCLAGRTSEIAM